ncbi:MAG: hypothetical protein B7733_08140 [Myxococcales bacterium FL481]|nr:MAG: hypothetical protein B7733_08140 [Myxococcales bacterium FL481]
MRRLSVRLISIGMLSAGLVGTLNCFDPPRENVLFSCEPDEAPQCPEDYECRSDGCCHHVDTDEDTAVGACGLVPPQDSGTGTFLPPLGHPGSPPDRDATRLPATPGQSPRISR